jgi:hypothetical protein
MGDYDKSSDQYRRKLVESPNDEAFYRGLLGQKEPYIPSYLYFNYPLDFKIYKEKVEKIIRAEYDSDEQKIGLDELRRSASNFSDEIKALLNERNRYKKWGTHPPLNQGGWGSSWDNSSQGANTGRGIPRGGSTPNPVTIPAPDLNSPVLGNREGGRSTSILPWFWLRR